MNSQRGGFLGMIVGLLIGLALALGVALYITKVPCRSLIKCLGAPPSKTRPKRKEQELGPQQPALRQKPGQGRAAPSAPAIKAESRASTPGKRRGRSLLGQRSQTRGLGGLQFRNPAAILAGEPVSTASAADAFSYLVQAGAYVAARPRPSSNAPSCP